MNQIITSGSCIRPLIANDLPMVRKWRNHPNVRKYMFSQHEISEEEHKCWFEKCTADKKWHLFIFEKDGISLGFVSFHEVNDGGVVDWGFYLSPNTPKGTGNLLSKTTLPYAFDKLNFHKVCGKVLSYNQKSIDFHLRLGFKEEGRLREQYFDGENYNSVVLFGLLKNESRNNY
jgi:UDP-4-amino-4,6-dideoxy-N-acetyl-beta-L-altrosamine N-acetyltransferase